MANSLDKQRNAKREQDKRELKRLLDGNQGKDFADRPTEHTPPVQFAVNALKGVGDFGSGLSTVLSALPSIADNYIKFYGKDISNPKTVQRMLTDTVTALPGLAKAVGRQYAKNYGQSNGFNAGNLVKSLYYHPENALDVLPLAGGISKAVRGTSNLSGVVSKMGKVGKAFDAMGEIPRYKGSLKTNSIDAVTKGDNFIKFATQSGANQYGKGFKGAGEMKGFKNLSPGTQHTLAHVYGEQLKGLDPEIQKGIIDTAKAKMEVGSLKDIPSERLSELVDTIRENIPALPKSQVDIKSKRLVTGARIPEPYIPPLQGMIEKGLGKSNTMFKSSVLSTPAWLTGNAAGDIYHTLTGGENIASVIKNGLDPRYKSLVNEADLGGFYKNNKKFLEATERLRKEAPIVSKIADVAKPFFNMEGKREGIFRQGVFANQLNKLAEQSLIAKKIKPTTENIFNEATILAKRSPAYDEAIKQSKQVLGDYGTFKPGENQLGAVVPFYKWFREASKVAAHQPIRNPIGYGGLKGTSELGQDIQDQQQESLFHMGYQIPAYNKGGFVTGVNDAGVPQIFNAGKLLPITTVSGMANDMAEGDLRSLIANKLTPIAGSGLKVLSGTNFTGRPATSPNEVTDFNGIRYYHNPQTNENTQLDPGTLPPGEALNYALSEFGRTQTPLGLIERALPINTYDTRMFQPDQSRGSKKENLLRNFGLGNTSNAFKIPPMNDKRLEERYNKRLNY